MEISLGRRADYAIRAVLDLARHHGGQLRKARQIVDAMQVPASYLPQILAQLVHAGIASSTAGPHGGYGLTDEPAAVTLLDVVRAVEGDPSSTRCVIRGGPCHWEGVCAVHEPWSRAQRALLEELDRTSFADLVALDEDLEAADPATPVAGTPVD